jgi:hypothetical protein
MLKKSKTNFVTDEHRSKTNESDPDVRFPNFILAGEGNLPKTFLTSGMAPSGEELD